MATQAAARMPPEFLQAPDHPTMEVEFYIDEIQNYLAATGAEKFTESRRLAIVQNILGFHARRILKATSAKITSVDDVFALLRKLFPASHSLTIARLKFNERSQKEGESVLQYYAEISSLSTKCDYKDLREELVRDKLIMCVRPEIKEKILLERPETLQDALQTALRLEAIIGDLKTVVPSACEINHLSTGTRGGTEGERRNRQSAAQLQGKKCFRCNAATHLANDSSCPARQKTCAKCGVLGHFAKVCRNSRGKEKAPNFHNGGVFSNLNNSHSLLKFVSVELHATDEAKSSSQNITNIRFGIDTGSSLSCISQDLYEQKFPDVPLQETNESFRDFSGNLLPIQGYMMVQFSWEGQVSKGRLYVVKLKSPPLLGITEFESLEIFRLWNNFLPVNSIGCVQNVSHKIRLKEDAVPTRQKLRRVPLSLRETVSQELKTLVENDIIEPIQESDWVSNIVTVQKPNGSLRLCLDLRDLNSSIVTTQYPLPHMDEVFLNLKDCSIYSVIDLKHAFLQVPLHSESRPLTAFITHEGLFQYKRIPFGLASAPCAFQKLMTEILGNRKGVQIFMDDVLIGGSTQTEHDERLKYVVETLHAAGFSLNTEKSKTSLSEIKFMGHIISEAGIRPDPDKVESIESAPPPKTPQEVKSFLGMTAFYAKFVPNYSKVTEPLLKLTRKAVAWEWLDAQQKAYKSLLQYIKERTTLSVFDPEKSTEIQVDASSSGLGAALCQRDSENNTHIIAFASRTLTQAEKNYAVIEREALAISFAVQKWKTFLWGTEFQIHTDHRPLVSIFNSRDTLRVNLRISRFVTHLLPYNYSVHYKPGSENVIADFLSRVTSLQTCSEPSCDGDMTVNSILSELTVSRDEMIKATESDAEMRLIKKWLCGSQLSKSEDRILSKYQSVKHELTFANEVLMRGTDQVVPPRSLRKELIQIAHEAHQGIQRTCQQLRLQFWWPQLQSDVQTFIINCHECNDSSKTTRFVKSEPVPSDIPVQPWSKLGIDIIGPMYELPHNYRYAITLMDYTSRFPYIQFSSDTNTETVIRFLTSVFAIEGLPRILVSDNGPQFLSKEFSDFLSRNDILHHRTPVYFAAANGLIERFNRTIKSQISIARGQGGNFQKYISNFLASYRSTPHPATHKTPSSVLHGREMVWCHNTSALNFQPRSANEVLPQLQNERPRNRAYKHPTYEPGEEVRVKLPNKIDTRTVASRGSQHTYQMTDGQRWHVSRMTKKGPTRRQAPSRYNNPIPQGPRYPTRHREAPSRYVLQE